MEENKYIGLCIRGGVVYLDKAGRCNYDCFVYHWRCCRNEEMRVLCLKESEEVQFTLTIWSLSLVAE